MGTAPFAPADPGGADRGAALTGLAMQASVDHVLGYAAVSATAGLLAGLATARPLSA